MFQSHAILDLVIFTLENTPFQSYQDRKIIFSQFWNGVVLRILTPFERANNYPNRTCIEWATINFTKPIRNWKFSLISANSCKVIESMNYLCNIFRIYHKNTRVPPGVPSDHSRNSVTIAKGRNSNCGQILPTTSENGYLIVQVAQIRTPKFISQPRRRVQRRPHLWPPCHVSAPSWALDGSSCTLYYVM